MGTSSDISTPGTPDSTRIPRQRSIPTEPGAAPSSSTPGECGKSSTSGYTDPEPDTDTPISCRPVLGTDYAVPESALYYCGAHDRPLGKCECDIAFTFQHGDPHPVGIQCLTHGWSADVRPA